MYIGVVTKFTLRFSYVHNAKIGHQVKSRARTNYIISNRLMDESKGTSSYLIDLPNPGKAIVTGNEMQQGRMAENWALIRSVQDLVLVNNTMVNDRGSGVFVQLVDKSESSLLQNNLLVGTGDLDVGKAAQRNNLRLADGGFKNRLRYDYRLSESSPAIDGGAPLDSSALPTELLQFEYRHVADKAPRIVSGVPDLGAHEFRSRAEVE
jgi:hypothetical protein